MFFYSVYKLQPLIFEAKKPLGQVLFDQGAKAESFKPLQVQRQ